VTGGAALNACGDDGNTSSTPTASTGTAGGGPGGGGPGGGGPGGEGGGSGGMGGGGPDANCPPEPTGNLPALKLTEIETGLSRPIYLTGAPNDPSRLYVVEQTGAIRIIKDGVMLPDPFLNVSNLIVAPGIGGGGNEQGLLGLAFHPKYQENGRFFIYYTANDAKEKNTVAEYARSADDPDRADPAGVNVLLGIDDFASNHNGGMLAFGKDGYLYVGTGDGGGSGDPNETGQALNSQLGKILRLDVENHPTPPPGNMPGGDQYIWEYGLRNPWRFAFDRCTGDLYIGDVGQNCWEEINVVPAGEGHHNFGWDVAEGNHCFNEANASVCNFSNCEMTGFTPAVAELPHADGHCSITGGYVYRGTKIPDLVGTYIYADYCSKQVFWLKWSKGMLLSEGELTDDLDSTNTGDIASFGEDTAGELYMLTLNGKIYRIDAE
jgi:glucose/arabinose dehydrogenase